MDGSQRRSEGFGKEKKERRIQENYNIIKNTPLLMRFQGPH